MALPKPQPQGAAPYALDGEILRYARFVHEAWEDAERYLFDLLYHKRLEAWGVMRKPIARIKQEPIPSEIFDNPKMGSNENVIKRLGYCYISVVVRFLRPVKAKSRALLTALRLLSSPPPQQDASTFPAERPKRPRRRPPVLEPIRAIIREFKEQASEDRGKKKKHNVIRRLAREDTRHCFRSQDNQEMTK